MALSCFILCTSTLYLNMFLFREEVFGPVAPLLRFKTEEEAKNIANDTNAGLCSKIFHILSQDQNHSKLHPFACLANLI